MDKKLKLAFLWHMHQPYYKDDKNSSTMMPWVFLHCLKDYYDIPWYSQKFDGIKATYNLVPSLIEQIKSYINHSANDKLLETIKKDIRVLNSEDIAILEHYLFLSNEKNMIKPLKRYYELYLKYKSHNTIKNFESQEILDTQMLFLLSWCGNYLRKNNHIVKTLLLKGNLFTHSEKLKLIDTLIKFLPTILEYYKQLNNNQKITLCTTPYYHPITPLLLDINSAKEARADVTIPNIESSFKELGERNTTDAIRYFEENFGVKPTGFWPAEGSVSQKTAELFSTNSLRWFCSDEEILFKTLNDRDKKNIYKNYFLKTNENFIDVRFRDHFLSDAIGFEYSQKDPKQSVDEFISHLKNIYDSCDFNPLVNVILDGENAWEFFPNNAQEFFYELYKSFENTPWIECVTMDEISSDKDIKKVDISHLASGSWINGNFDIWIGSDEKNRAWELLDITKKDYDKEKEHLNDEVKELIEKEFMIALGSDWFWWYGDEHFTVQAKEFDELFRKHLINIYNLMNIDTPLDILIPIVKDTQNSSFHIKPKSFITPTVDGIKSDYFEWLDCGQIDITKEFSVMDSTNNIVTKVLYGYDSDSISFLFEGDFSDNKKIDIKLDNKDIKDYEIFYTNLKVEVKIPLQKKEEKIDFKFEIKKDKKTLQTFPIYNDFIICIENLNLRKWYV
ncbi:MAG: glycoside hydrolase family 57 protein [Campylobacterota bacterium]|nr:glycoside hydrolase family 57 protein [Campylobacterota bacterium]